VHGLTWRRKIGGLIIVLPSYKTATEASLSLKTTIKKKILFEQSDDF